MYVYDSIFLYFYSTQESSTLTSGSNANLGHKTKSLECTCLKLKENVVDVENVQLY